jgi:hypothetical protein
VELRLEALHRADCKVGEWIAAPLVRHCYAWITGLGDCHGRLDCPGCAGECRSSGIRGLLQAYD